MDEGRRPRFNRVRVALPPLRRVNAGRYHGVEHALGVLRGGYCLRLRPPLPPDAVDGPALVHLRWLVRQPEPPQHHQRFQLKSEHAFISGALYDGFPDTILAGRLRSLQMASAEKDGSLGIQNTTLNFNRDRH